MNGSDNGMHPFCERGGVPRLVPGKFFPDARGSFTPFPLPAGCVQANVSVSAPGVVRGMHWQERHPQAKLLACVSGEIHDVCVDIRRDSPDFGRVFEFSLRGGTGASLAIPRGFAHGFEVVGDAPATVLYFIDEPWHPDDERGFLWTSVAASWRVSPSVAVLSEKDRGFPAFRDVFPAPVAAR